MFNLNNVLHMTDGEVDLQQGILDLVENWAELDCASAQAIREQAAVIQQAISQYGPDYCVPVVFASLARVYQIGYERGLRAKKDSNG